MCVRHRHRHRTTVLWTISIASQMIGVPILVSLITVNLATDSVFVIGSRQVADRYLDVLGTAKDSLGETCIVNGCNAMPYARRLALEILLVCSLHIDRVLGTKVSLEKWVHLDGLMIDASDKVAGFPRINFFHQKRYKAY